MQNQLDRLWSKVFLYGALFVCSVATTVWFWSAFVNHEHEWLGRLRDVNRQVQDLSFRTTTLVSDVIELRKEINALTQKPTPAQPSNPAQTVPTPEQINEALDKIKMPPEAPPIQPYNKDE